MVNNTGRRHLPPYVSYRTFLNFIDGLQQQIPSRIDRSYWGEMLSGSTGTQLMAALRFLSLTDDSGRPIGQLRSLVATKGDQRARLLREIAEEAFGFVLQGSFDPQNATYAQLQETFHSTFQVTDDVCRKCIKFFISLADDAGIPLSPFIIKRSRSKRTETGIKVVTKRERIRTNRHDTVPLHTDEIPTGLLDKFPDFDPSWSAEVQLKWFEAFDKLMTLSHAGSK